MSSYFENESKLTPAEEAWKKLKYGEDMAYCIRNGLCIYPTPMSWSIYFIDVDYLGKITRIDEIVDNPFGDDIIRMPIQFKKKTRYKKDKDIWKYIMNLYKEYYIKLKTIELDEQGKI